MTKKDRWFIPTNTENLKMIIAQGLISNPDGFKKYYSDILELVQGYIPIFKNEIGQEILTYVVNETDDLTPAIIEIDLKKILSVVKKVAENKLVDMDLNDINSKDILFIQAPLPLSVISTLIFKSRTDKKNFIDDSKLYSNVVLADLKLSSTVTEQKLFKQNTFSVGLVSYFKDIETVETNKVDYNKVYAYGGLLLNLFYFAKNGNRSNALYQLFSNLDKESEKQDIDVYDYFKAFDSSDTNIKRKMDYGLINISIESKDFKEEIFDFLLSDIWDERSAKRTKELANKLKQFESNMDKTVSEQFKEAKTALEKTLLMLFLREDSDSLMDYMIDVFTEEDYLNFAMMFGVRDKFIKIPKELREFSGLQNFVSLKMAEYAHSSIDSNIKFKALPKSLTLIDMLNKNSLKKKLLKELKIEHCVQTVMPNKEYSSKNGINTYVGFIEPTYKILNDEYFKTISKKRLTKLEYNKFAKMR